MIADHSHRPWPVPKAPWVMHMGWRHVAFLHWRVDAEELRRLMPSEVPLDIIDGSAWLAVTPLEMFGVRPRLLPPAPGVSRFPELNVRTYVTIDGKPGIWFFSLDAASRLAVRGARLTFNLPYYDAQMSIRTNDNQGGEAIGYQSARRQSGAPPAEFAARYGPTGPVYQAQPGSLEYALIERYCLYTVGRDNRLYRGEIHHPPWPLQQGEADVSVNTMAAAIGVTLPAETPLIHYAKRQDVVAWPPARVE